MVFVLEVSMLKHVFLSVIVIFYFLSFGVPTQAALKTGNPNLSPPAYPEFKFDIMSDSQVTIQELESFAEKYHLDIYPVVNVDFSQKYRNSADIVVRTENSVGRNENRYMTIDFNFQDFALFTNPHFSLLCFKEGDKKNIVASIEVYAAIDDKTKAMYKTGKYNISFIRIEDANLLFGTDDVDKMLQAHNMDLRYCEKSGKNKDFIVIDCNFSWRGHDDIRHFTVDHGILYYVIPNKP